MSTALRTLPVRTLFSYSARSQPAQRLWNFTKPVALTAKRTMSAAKDMSTVQTDSAPKALGPYSQAIKTPTAIYCSGQIPLTASGALVKGDVGAKTAQVCENIKAVLAAAGTSVDRVVKTTIFLADIDRDFGPMNAEYEKHFAHKPARSCVQAAKLPLGVDVEIECIALPGAQ